ncbi:hypothetical protein B0J12DRAFT_444723 [Macrophomina phaseolina]|uniref:10TM putative phosphate transporter extracellular tail domain-containing protein n=1 Tax=Macrophomina phaseolina TaxID=35725 RepID=A0ABQ8FTF0_9PEZI|nr:hypothetical protein B0J12DRAFT_444723 [Macrophomina phaseolina]
MTFQEQDDEYFDPKETDEAGVSSRISVRDASEGFTKAKFISSILTSTYPLVRIPRDEFGISQEEINRVRRYSSLINITDEQANVDSKGRVALRKVPCVHN